MYMQASCHSLHFSPKSGRRHAHSPHTSKHSKAWVRTVQSRASRAQRNIARHSTLLTVQHTADRARTLNVLASVRGRQVQAAHGLHTSLQVSDTARSQRTVQESSSISTSATQKNGPTAPPKQSSLVALKQVLILTQAALWRLYMESNNPTRQN